MRSTALGLGALGLATLVAVVLGACTSSDGVQSAAPSVTTRTVTSTNTVPASIGPTAPVVTGPTTSATATACPLVATRTAANQVGMRLARITVQTSGDKAVGCRFYALQTGALHNSERLPGPKQPAVQITTARYASATAAHNAFVLVARKGTNPQVETFGVDNDGSCFQTAFYPPDKGTDWACAFSVDKTAIFIKTVVTSPALNVVRVGQEVAQKV